MGHHTLGNEPQPNMGLPVSYFEARDCWLDLREKDCLHIHPEANIGWDVKLVCQTHDMTPGMFNRTLGRKIKIGKGAFIGAFSILYNCEIGEGAIVAVGSVVRSMTVHPFTMVEGNPARVIKTYNAELREWVLQRL